MILGGLYLVAIAAFAFSPETTDVGYEPKQPVPFSHKLHAGKLKMDCRYCHTTVEDSAHAAVPPTQTCINCHSPADANGNVATTAIHTKSPKLVEVHQSYASGRPILWNKVHDLPDYAYFNHAAHVRRGVSCVSCHGRVDQMEVVRQVEPLSMAWCLKCHREPEKHLRPPEAVTDLGWVAPEDAELIGRRIKEQWNIKKQTNCSTCHR